MSPLAWCCWRCVKRAIARMMGPKPQRWQFWHSFLSTSPAAAAPSLPVGEFAWCAHRKGADRKFSFTVECQRRNVEEMEALESHHLVTAIIVTIYSDKKNQWMPNQQVKICSGKFVRLQNVSHIMLLLQRKKVVTLHWAKLTSSVTGQMDLLCLLIRQNEKNTASPLCCSWARCIPCT